MSDWATIDKLGTAGMVPDKPSDHMQPSELDLAVNVRAIGPNLTNAGGFSVVTEFFVPPNIGQVSMTQFIPFEARVLAATGRLTQFALLEVVQSDEYP